MSGWVGQRGERPRFYEPLRARQPRVVETVGWEVRPGRRSAFHVFADWRVWWTDDEGEREAMLRRGLRDVEPLLCGHAVTREQLRESGELVALEPDQIPEWPFDRPGTKLCGICQRLLVAEVMAELPQPWVYHFARAFEESRSRAKVRAAAREAGLRRVGDPTASTLRREWQAMRWGG